MPLDDITSRHCITPLLLFIYDIDMAMMIHDTTHIYTRETRATLLIFILTYIQPKIQYIHREGRLYGEKYIRCHTCTALLLLYFICFIISFNIYLFVIIEFIRCRAFNRIEYLILLFNTVLFNIIWSQRRWHIIIILLEWHEIQHFIMPLMVYIWNITGHYLILNI